MQTTTLISLIKKDETISQYFRGCVTVNQFIDEAYLYKDSNTANFWIIYASPSTGNLGHFFMFGCKNIVGGNISASSGTWYCDSYALKPAYYSSRLEGAFQNLSTYGAYQSIPFQLQHDSSNVCALYSMFFADKFCSTPMSEQLRLSDFVLRNFIPANNTVENDSRVLSYFETKLRVPKRKLNCNGANFCTSLNKFLKTPRDSSVE